MHDNACAACESPAALLSSEEASTIERARLWWLLALACPANLPDGCTDCSPVRCFLSFASVFVISCLLRAFSLCLVTMRFKKRSGLFGNIGDFHRILAMIW